MNPPTPTPRTDAAWAKTFEDDEDQCRAGNAASDMRDECATIERELIALTGTHTCTHHNDQQRAACPVCLVTALTAELDQLRADCENETKWAAHYLAQSIADKARAEKAEDIIRSLCRISNIPIGSDAAMKGTQ